MQLLILKMGTTFNFKFFIEICIILCSLLTLRCSCCLALEVAEEMKQQPFNECVAVSVCLNSVPVVNYSETFYLLSCMRDG